MATPASSRKERLASGRVTDEDFLWRNDVPDWRPTLTVPDDYRVESVTGSNVLQWVERKQSGPRQLDITLKERTAGAYTLRLELVRTFKELPKSLVIAGVHPLHTSKLAGFISVSSESGVAVKMESFDGLTEIPAASLPDYSAIGNVEWAPGSACTIRARRGSLCPC